MLGIVVVSYGSAELLSTHLASVDRAAPGGGVLLGDLDDGLLDGDRPSQEVDVPGSDGDELAPAESGLDVHLDEEAEPVGDLGQELVVLVGVRIRPAGDDLGQLDSLARVRGDDPVAVQDSIWCSRTPEPVDSQRPVMVAGAVLNSVHLLPIGRVTLPRLPSGSSGRR